MTRETQFQTRTDTHTVYRRRTLVALASSAGVLLAGCLRGVEGDDGSGSESGDDQIDDSDEESDCDCPE